MPVAFIILPKATYVVNENISLSLSLSLSVLHPTHEWGESQASLTVATI
jgi:hypothetical protein